MHLAAYLNLTHVVRELMEKGASLELQDCDGNTALHVACQQGQTDMASEMTRHVSPSKLAPILETQNWKGKQTGFLLTSSSKICHLKHCFCDYFPAKTVNLYNLCSHGLGSNLSDHFSPS